MSSKQNVVADFFAGRKRAAFADELSADAMPVLKKIVKPRAKRQLAAKSNAISLSRPAQLAITAGDGEGDAAEASEILADKVSASSSQAVVAGAVAASTSQPAVAPEVGDLAVGVLAAPAVGIVKRSTTIGLLVSPEIPLRPTCGKCKSSIMDPLRAVVTGKGPGCWECPE